MGEAISCYEGIKLVTFDSKSVLINTDCLSLLEVLDLRGEDRSPTKVVDKVYHRLIPKDKVIKLDHVNRNEKLLGHVIAKFYRRELCGVVLLGQVPTHVLELAPHGYMSTVMKINTQAC